MFHPLKGGIRLSAAAQEHGRRPHEADIFRTVGCGRSLRDARARRADASAILSAGALASRQPAWEPPVDVLETEREVLVLVALPGVDPDEVEAVIDGGDLVVAGTRMLPAELRTAVIHRLELPQGRFRTPGAAAGRALQRHPPHSADGCLLVLLKKVGGHHVAELT